MEVSVPAEPAAKRQRGDPEFASLTLRHCHQLLTPLKKMHNEVYFFMHPVDYVRLGIPDYPHIVKKPMDLGTVERRLQKGEYLSVDDFVADGAMLARIPFLVDVKNADASVPS